MTERPAAAAVRLALLALAAGVAVFALSVRTPGVGGLQAFRPAPPNPHPPGLAACVSCHRSGGDVEPPVTHRAFDDGTCATCHAPVRGAAPR